MPPLTNKPAWTEHQFRPYQEVWYLKFNDVILNRALWLRWTLLSCEKMGPPLAETWAIFFEKKDKGEVVKSAFKETYPISAFSELDQRGQTGIRIGDCELGDRHTKGRIQSNGRSIEWNLTLESNDSPQFNFVPERLSRWRIVKNTVTTVGEYLLFTGVTKIQAQVIDWKASPGMQGHLHGTKNGHSWVWGHCNTFQDEKGNPSAAIFDGLAARARLTKNFATPELTAIFIRYQEREFYFNSVCDSIRIQNRHGLTEWDFRARHHDRVFHGQLKAQLNHFAGLTYADTDGSHLYCANSKLSDMNLDIYLKGQLESRLMAKGSAAYENVSRMRPSGVEFLL